jgi:hypothetical protein
VALTPNEAGVETLKSLRPPPSNRIKVDSASRLCRTTVVCGANSRTRAHMGAHQAGWETETPSPPFSDSDPARTNTSGFYFWPADP